MKHTKLHHAHYEELGLGNFPLFNQNNEYLGVVGDEADAKLIVKAVNEREGLIDTLKCVCSLFPEDMSDDESGRMGFNRVSQITINEARATIKQAEES